MGCISDANKTKAHLTTATTKSAHPHLHSPFNQVRDCLPTSIWSLDHQLVMRTAATRCSRELHNCAVHCHTKSSCPTSSKSSTLSSMPAISFQMQGARCRSRGFLVRMATPNKIPRNFHSGVLASPVKAGFNRNLRGKPWMVSGWKPPEDAKWLL